MSWDEDEDEYQQAFGEHTSISDSCRRLIRAINNNDEKLQHLGLGSEYTLQFNNHAWKLLGKYIANNTHIKSIKLCRFHLTDEQMVLLFSGLRSSSSLQRLDLGNNEFGIDGVRSMIPFLGLTHLNFNNNSIGKEGFITISNMLQHEGSTLTHLCLVSTGMGDEEAEILADSLKDNTTLKELNLGNSNKNLGNNNNMTRRGRLALLKLMVDISSVESTYKSNHTLIMCYLSVPGDRDRISSFLLDEPGDDVHKQITKAWAFNRSNSSQSYPNPNPTSRHTAGRLKIVHYQLNSKKRKELCQIQGVEYSDSNIFADIEPILLPNILSLIGSEHGQSELYTALIHTAPDLLSYMDRKAMINNEMEKNKAHDNDLVVQIAELTRQRAALSAKNDKLSSRLALIHSGDMNQRSAVGKEDKGNGGSSSKKRQRN